MKSPQINSLTATRAFAAIMVFIHHYGGAIFPFTLLPAVFRSGNIAVSYFFVLSGFVLNIAYRERESGYTDYIKRRLGRIVPMYMLALMLSVVVLALYYSYPVGEVKSAKEMGLSALLLQAYVPSYPLVINGPGWSISVEMLFYLLFPAVLWLQRRRPYYFGIALVVLFVSSQLLHLKYYPHRHSLPDNIVDTVFFNPAIHLSQFMLGMVACELYTRSTVPKNMARLLMYLSFAGIIALLVLRPENVSYHVGLIAPFFMLFVIATAITNPWMLNLRPLVYLGEISYGIYILQLPVYMLVAALNVRYMHMTPPFLFISALAVLIAAAAISYRWVERPLREMISGRLKGLKG